VELDDRITISTPEGIELRLALAGAGSRFIATVIDLCLQAVLILLAALVTFGLIGGSLGVALFVMAVFAALYLYNVLFEVLAAGRTPGKRLTHLRVVRELGTPVDFRASAIRNLLRLLDLLPTAYLAGLLSILLTERNQRLGDLAAGTIVIRDAPRQKTSAAPLAAQAQPASPSWDVSAVSAAEVAAVRRFLARRGDLDRDARLALARRLEQGLRVKVAGAPEGLGPEAFLEGLAREKAAR
jgi:uncharacterized RDD family membrane protein YckC